MPRRLPADLETTTSSSIGRTARIASRCELACTPAPKITSRWASGAARNRVASAETAAVRIAVSDDPSITARSDCVAASNRTYVAWTNGSPASGFSGVRVTSLTPRASSPNAGISRTVPRSVDTDERGGAVASSVANALSRASIADG